MPAAGSGKRFGGAKAFVKLLGKPLIAWTLSALEAVDEIGEIIPVFKKGDMEAGLRLIEEYSFSKVRRVAPGGAERQDSVLAGLRLVQGAQTVLIHDGARPLAETALIKAAIAGLEGYDGSIAAVPPKDTIKESGDGTLVGRTLDRKSLWAVQTPQVFRHEALIRAYEQAGRDGFYSTDDAALVERYGGKVRIVMGSYANIKVTTPEDLRVAELFLTGRIEGKQ